MSEYNIQMNKYNALNAEYDQLYPQPMKHANTHAKDGSDPILPSSIGAAPSTHASQHASGGADPITPEAIGAAMAIHTHDAGDIISGILAVARGGTGVSSLEELAAALGISGTKIETGSYTGNGKTAAHGYVNSITFSFSPSIIIVAGGSYSSSSSNTYGCAIMANVGKSSAVCTVLGYDYLVSPSACWIAKADVKFSENTVSWGVGDLGVRFNLGTQITIASVRSSPQYQLNNSGATYNWIAIG